MSSPRALALVNARIRTRELGDTRTAREAGTALLVEGGRVAAIGDDHTILDRARSRSEVVDLGGAVVSPGFIDAHIHAFACAMAALEVSCLPPAVESLGELQRRLAERAASIPPGAWVIGRGYDDTRLAEGRHPTRLDLDEAASKHPVVVTRSCGHISVANTRALHIAGIDGDTIDPQGGTIVRDAAGLPTGLLLERAQGLVLDAVPPAGVEEILRALLQTGRALAQHGVTTICEALLGAFHPLEPRIWSWALSDGWRGPKVLFLADPQLARDDSVSDLPIIGTKLFADGVVAGRTAAMSQPFEGSQETGILIHEADRLEQLVESSVALGLPVSIHAMGDRAIAAAIAAIEHAEHGRAARRLGGRAKTTGRHRIEHCTLPDTSSLHKMRSLGIVPVPQPVFLFAEGEAYRDALGERSERAYPTRTMIRQGLRPALSSDAPATSWEDPIDPWLGIRAAVTRRTWAGSQLGSRETISVEEAISCYTSNGAAALSIEGRTGSIEVGKDADLMVLDEDPLTAVPQHLEKLRPRLVLIKGRIAHGETN
jgi:predicted amidohydrolase YtcJ